MTNFITMQSRIARELLRTNMELEIKDAINDAIKEAAKTRFYFNEYTGATFPTVAGQEYYDDLGLVEVDEIYLLISGQKHHLTLRSDLDAAGNLDGTVITGQPYSFSRYGSKFRLDPVPSAIYTVKLTGYGKLTPSPLVGNNDTNAWMTEGEEYIRALAKRNLLRDRIRNYGEAAIYDGVADDYKTKLDEVTTQRSGTGTIYPTQF